MPGGALGDELRSILIGTAALDAGAVVALILTLARGPITASPVKLRSAVRAANLALLCQCAHFVEELLSGFSQRFPELLGLDPWATGFFVPFNLAWIAVWVLSSRGLARRRRVALFPLWFLGIGCLMNGLAHPAFAMLVGHYFPGLVTSPLVGLAGLLLLRQLARVTAAPAR